MHSFIQDAGFIYLFIFLVVVKCSTDDIPQAQPYQNQLTVPHMLTNPDSSPESTPSPLPRSSSSANLQSASKLILSSTLVYSHRLELPLGVEVVRATPSAGTASIPVNESVIIETMTYYNECRNIRQQR